MIIRRFRRQTLCRFSVVMSFAVGILVSHAHGADDFEVFNLGDFALESGKTLPGAKVIYATQGKLNAAKDNAILAPSHYGARAIAR